MLALIGILIYNGVEENRICHPEGGRHGSGNDTPCPAQRTHPHTQYLLVVHPEQLYTSILIFSRRKYCCSCVWHYLAFVNAGV